MRVQDQDLRLQNADLFLFYFITSGFSFLLPQNFITAENMLQTLLPIGLHMNRLLKIKIQKRPVPGIYLYVY